MMMRGPAAPKWVDEPRCTDQDVEVCRCPDREPRLAACRLARHYRRGPFALVTDGHHDEPRTPDQGRNIAMSRDEPELESAMGDHAELAHA